jgi:hypothetical protein
MVTDTASLLRKLRIKVSPYRMAMIRYCERRGLRFSIDFGTDNASKKARELRNKGRRA